MKKLENLKIEVLSVLTDSEMRDVLGGRYDHLVPIGATTSIKQLACVGKNAGDSCSFETSAISHGKCRMPIFSGGGLYCSDMRQA